jgi:hypothetical protein
MNCREIIEIATRERLIRPDGKTPQNTLNAAIRRNIQNSGDKSLFVDVGKGLFRLKKRK